MGNSVVTLSGIFGAAASWGSALWTNVSRAGRTMSAAGDSDQAAAAQTNTLQAASSALRTAFDAFTAHVQPVFTNVTMRRAASAASAGGTAARLGNVDVPYSVLAATSKINVQTTTVRSSSSALGLDLASAASQLSSGALGLDVTSAQAQSTLTSTGEIRPAWTSYGSTTLNFSGSGAPSTSVATLSGTYTGVNTAAAATSLTVKIKSTTPALNTITASTVNFEVVDQAGTVLFTHNASVKAGEQISLGADIGLSISFSTGSLSVNHTASTTVSHNNADIDADATFNNANASLRPQFEGGAQVTAGSFTINGTTITVNANDTINLLLGRINASSAGVTAALSNDRITLTSTSNSEDAIVVAGDTSGFLSATKLSGATTTRGNIRDDQQVFAKTSQLSGVTDGSFQINGRTISIDNDVDTIASVVSKINSAGAGVSATFNTSTNKIDLVSTSPSEDLITVGSDTTGFLAATGLSTGNTVRGKIADDVQTFSTTSQFSAVTTGSFNVNGVSISVNRDTDTLQTVIARVNSANAGVTASYNSATDKVVFTPTVAGATLSLESDTSGFLTAAKVSSGTVGTQVNVDAAFNASGSSGPLFDPGLTVQAGSFTVNGVSISVAANDTVNTVLSRITASAANVTATYDSTTGKVKLASKSGTSAIVLASDTSGFLAAVKLDGTAAAGTETTPVSAFDLKVSGMTEYASVHAGVVTIDGHDIAIDPGSTTLHTFVSAVDALDGISASLNETTGLITILGSTPGATITFSDTSGLLAAVGITTGAHSGAQASSASVDVRTGSVAVSNARNVASEAGTAIRKLNDAIAAVGSGDKSVALRRELTSALESAVQSLRDSGVRGLSVTSANGQPRVAVDEATLTAALERVGDQTVVAAAIKSVVERFNDTVTSAAAKDEARARAQSMPMTAPPTAPPAAALPKPPESKSPSYRRPAGATRKEITKAGASRWDDTTYDPFRSVLDFPADR